MEESGFSGLRHRLFLQSELAKPALYAAMVLIGSAFALRPTRFGQTGVMILFAVLAGFALYFLKDFAETLQGRSGRDPADCRRLDAAGRGDPARHLSLLLHLEDGSGGRAGPLAGPRARRRARPLCARAGLPAEGPDMPASLIADQVTYDRESGLLVATGNVEVLYEGRVLRARRIVYDEAADGIRAEGPLVLTDPAGGVLLADAAALTPDLDDGLITSARLLIAGKMQLAAVEMRRSGGRYATLYRTVASSCTICPENPTPTWALRASRITRDTAARRIYFENARFELFGVPIGYVPRLSIPEPGVERASGVHRPSSSDIFGLGFKLPYYRVLGPSADVTVTPFVTTKGGVLLEGEYRPRFANGGFDISGVFALDDGLAEDGTSHGCAARRAARGRLLGCAPASSPTSTSRWRATTSFLTQFDYSDADRLTSTASINRTRRRVRLARHRRLPEPARRRGRPTTCPSSSPSSPTAGCSRLPGLGGRLGIDGKSLGVLRDVGSNMVRGGGGSTGTATGAAPRHPRLDAPPRRSSTSTGSGTTRTSPTGGHPRVPTAAVELRWPLVRLDRRRRTTSSSRSPRSSGPRPRREEDVPNEDSQLPSSTRPTSSRSTAFPARTG